MKKFRVLIILLAVLLLCLALLSMAKSGFFGKEKKETVYTSKGMFEYETNDADRFGWTYNGKTYNFTKDAEGVWTYDDDKSIPIDQTKIRTMLVIHHQIMTTKAIDGVEDFSEYGIDLSEPPAATAVCGDKVFSMWLGGPTKLTKDLIYAADKEGVVYVVDAYVRDSFAKDLEYVTEKPEESKTAG